MKTITTFYEGQFCLECKSIVTSNGHTPKKYCKCGGDPDKRNWVNAKIGMDVNYQENTLYDRMYTRLLDELGSYQAGAYTSLSESSRKAINVLEEFKEELLKTGGSR